MTEYNNDTYKELKEEYVRISKRILKERISTVESTLEAYKVDIVASHNVLITYVKTFYSQFDAPTKRIFKTELIQIRDRIKRCFEKLHIRHNFSEYLLKLVNRETLDELEYETEDEKNFTIVGLNSIVESDSEYLTEHFENQNVNMAGGRVKFLQLCATTIVNAAMEIIKPNCSAFDRLL